jgi:hypothetical protein
VMAGVPGGAKVSKRVGSSKQILLRLVSNRFGDFALTAPEFGSAAHRCVEF